MFMRAIYRFDNRKHFRCIKTRKRVEHSQLLKIRTKMHLYKLNAVSGSAINDVGPYAQSKNISILFILKIPLFVLFVYS